MWKHRNTPGINASQGENNRLEKSIKMQLALDSDAQGVDSVGSKICFSICVLPNLKLNLIFTPTQPSDVL